MEKHNRKETADNTENSNHYIIKINKQETEHIHWKETILLISSHLLFFSLKKKSIKMVTFKKLIHFLRFLIQDHDTNTFDSKV